MQPTFYRYVCRYYAASMRSGATSYARVPAWTSSIPVNGANREFGGRARRGLVPGVGGEGPRSPQGAFVMRRRLWFRIPKPRGRATPGCAILRSAPGRALYSWRFSCASNPCLFLGVEPPVGKNGRAKSSRARKSPSSGPEKQYPATQGDRADEGETGTPCCGAGTAHDARAKCSHFSPGA